jgi:hypothetical protein
MVGLVVLGLSIEPEVKNGQEYCSAGNEEAPILFHVLEPKKFRIGNAARSSHSAYPPFGTS